MYTYVFKYIEICFVLPKSDYLLWRLNLSSLAFDYMLVYGYYDFINLFTE